jgi:DNA-binding NarL/FixJ family response regulator
MTIRRVFVIWTHPLFHESVRLLLERPQIEWVGATSDHEAAHHHIASLQPDTILIEELEGGQAGEEALKLLEGISSDIRIIRFSLENNELTIYHREQRTVGQAGDLLKLIEGV